MLLDDIKLRLRINHDLLNSEITETIATARAEMISKGVDATTANGNSNLVNEAIKTFCQYKFGNDKTADGFFESWRLQLDELRKSSNIN